MTEIGDAMEYVRNSGAGFTAHARGKPRDANPHPAGSAEHAAWDAGWLDREQHENDKADALDSIGWFGRK
jgi:hypothetical protein